jgi:hypothetical protein
MKAFYLFASIISLFIIGCGDENKCSTSYILKHPVSVQPIKESYEIGDTIWLEMNFSNNIEATSTNNWTGESWNDTIILKDFDFHRNYLRILKLTDISLPAFSQTNAWGSFSHLFITGTIIFEHPFGPEYKLVYNNNFYTMKIGIVCKESGQFIYAPYFRNYYNATDPASNIYITGQCDEEYLIDIRFPVNRQPDGFFQTNYDLFEKFMNPSLESDLDRIKNECFTFVVK